MERSILNEFRLSVSEQSLGVYGVHVYQEGKGELSHRFRSDDRECLYSASKTFTSVAVGMCQDEGRLKITDRVADFFPEYKEYVSSGTEQLTLRDLLHMSSGKRVFWFSQSEEQYTDWAKLFLQDPVYAPGGTEFCYSNACTYMLGRVVEKVSGQSLRDYLMERLFIPLHIFNPQWQSCPMGHTIAATGLYLKTDELARMGRLLLQRGQWEGRQLVSGEYVDQMHSDWIDCSKNSPDLESACGYGYQVWRCTQLDAYRLDGMYGQFSIVIPSKKAVVTVTSHNEKCPNDIIRAVFRDIVPHL